MKKFAELGIALGLFLSLSACGDVPPNQNTTALLDHHQTQERSITPAQKYSYYYLLGIGAEGDPLTAGQRYHDEMQTLLAQDGITDEQITMVNQRHPLATLPTAESRKLPMFCSIGAKNADAQACLNSLLNDKFELDAHATVYERYQQFLAQPATTSMGKTHPSIKTPSYAVLLQGQRLYLLHHLRQHPQTAMTALSAELATLRSRLAHAHTLLDKMVYAKMIAFNLQSMVQLKAHHPAINTSVIPPLTPQERSLKSASVGEFMTAYASFENLSHQKGNALDATMTSLLYKKNKTINAMADGHAEQIRVSELSDTEFVAHINHHTPQPTKQDPTNFIGHTLAQIGTPDLYQYTYKVRSIDNLINITNHQLHGTPLHNVFFDDNSKILTQDDKICLPINSPNIEPDADMECLIIPSSTQAHR